jgi:hypothetical protein
VWADPLRCNERTFFSLVLRRNRKCSKCGTYYVSFRKRENTFWKEKQREKEKRTHTHTHVRNNTKKESVGVFFLIFSKWWLVGEDGESALEKRKDEETK